ncbi:MAG: hypothetical protein LUF34_04685, partial [Lachnospiraceae bacterium]|nr:hypothetical protein [Lachnospiraceae bacterium]
MKYTMKKCLLLMLSLAFVAALAGCGTTAGSEESDASSTEAESSETPTEEPSDGISAEEQTLQDCYLVTNVYGDGQKPWYIVLVYDTEIDPSSVSTEDYEVDGYEI